MKQQNRILSLMLAVLLVVSMVPASVMTVFAADTYTVTFDVGDGTGTVAPMTGVFDAVAHFPEGPTPPEGMVFFAWVEDVNDDSYKKPDSSFRIKENTTYHAVYFPTDGSFIYRVNEQDVYIMGYISVTDRLVIPDTYQDKPVTRIYEDAFKHCLAVTSVVVPESITRIDQHAFDGCREMESVELPSHSVKFGGYVFLHCSSLKSIILPKNSTYEDGMLSDCISLEEVTLPDDMDQILASFFQNCTNLTEITLPASVEYIEQTAFANCDKLKKLVLPEGLLGMDYEAFSMCDALTELIIPRSVNRLYSLTFSDYNGTVLVYKDSYAHTFCEENGIPYAFAPSVQVGQVTLENGEYTKDGKSTTTTKPESGGYAHFENGVLTLNNFTYSGGSVNSNPAIGSNLAAIFCQHDLTIKVEGKNSITRVVTDADTDTEAVLRGIWVSSGELKIIGDDKEDFLEVIVNGHDNTAAHAVNGNSEGVVIENCTLEAKSATGGAGLYVAGDVTITGADVLGSSGIANDYIDTFGIYAATLKVKDSDVVAVAEDNSNDGANGLWIAGSTGKLIFESGSIIGRTSDVSDDSYAIYVNTGNVTLPANYWMRTSESAGFAEGTWDGANVGPYFELTTTQPHIHIWDNEYDSDGEHHWKNCTVAGCPISDNAQKEGYGQHNPNVDDGDCSTAVTCAVCEAVTTLAKSHSFTVLSTELASEGDCQSSKTYYAKCANCDQISDTVTVPSAEYGDHKWDTEWTNDGDRHWHKCLNTVCNEIKDDNPHSGGTATCTDKAKCSVCGEEYGKLLDHIYEWVIDKEPTANEEGSKHEECTVCKAKQNENTAIPKNEQSTPQTGDSSGIMLCIALLFIACIGAGATVCGRKKRID